MCLDINLVLLLELLRKVFHQTLVDIPTSKLRIPRRGLDIELSLTELHNGTRVARKPDIYKSDSPRLLVRRGEIQFRDSPTEGTSRRLINEPQQLQPSNLRRIMQTPPLNIRKPRRTTQHDVRHLLSNLRRRGGLDLTQIHPDQLRARKLLLFAHIRDFGANLAVDIAEGGGVVFLLDLDVGIVEGAAGEAVEGADGVLQVGGFLGLGCFADVSALGTEPDEGPAGVNLLAIIVSYIDRYKDRG